MAMGPPWGATSARPRGLVPVSKHHGVTEALGAGFMEPLPAAVALQHLQVPPGRGQQNGDSEGSEWQPPPLSPPSQGEEIVPNRCFWGPRCAAPCKPGVKHPHPDPISLFPTRPLAALRQGLTLRAPRSSSSTAAGWCGVGSPTPAARGCRTAPSSRPAASWRWLLSSGHPLSVGEAGTGSAQPPLCRAREERGAAALTRTARAKMQRRQNHGVPSGPSAPLATGMWHCW